MRIRLLDLCCRREENRDAEHLVTVVGLRISRAVVEDGLGEAACEAHDEQKHRPHRRQSRGGEGDIDEQHSLSSTHCHDGLDCSHRRRAGGHWGVTLTQTVPAPTPSPRSLLWLFQVVLAIKHISLLLLLPLLPSGLVSCMGSANNIWQIRVYT